MINQFFCDVSKQPSFVRSADSRSAGQQHWYRACRLNSRYVVGSGWYVWSGAVVWRHMDMHETWDSVQWLWTLTSGNSVDADLWESEVTRGSTSFLFEGRESKKTRGGWGERGTHKRGYWLVWREERGRLMMPSSHLAIMVDFLLFTFPFKKAFPAPWWKERLSVLWDTHVCVLGGSVGWGDWTVMPFWFTARLFIFDSNKPKADGKDCHNKF